MKKLLIILLLFIGTSVSAQVINLKTTAFTFKEYNRYTKQWSEWSKWQSSNMLVTINANNDKIIIYSPSIQIYRVYGRANQYYDYDGEYNTVFDFIDQDNDKGQIRLLKRKSGNVELYVEFANVKWCYRVVEYEN